MKPTIEGQHAYIEGDDVIALLGDIDYLTAAIPDLIGKLKEAIAAGWTEIRIEADTEWDNPILRIRLSRLATAAELNERAEANRLRNERSTAARRALWESLRREFGD